jgi:hypothetical protein
LNHILAFMLFLVFQVNLNQNNYLII